MTALRLHSSGPGRVIDFDVETVAAGFADPEWVPQKVTCVAWSWVGSDTVESRICGPLGVFGRPDLRRKMLAALLNQIRQADVVTGHNIERFDIPVINAECMRLGLEPLRGLTVQDTMRVVRAKGFKKGQDNLGRLYKTQTEKLALDWQAWQDGYDEIGDNLRDLTTLGPNVWRTIRDRAESDVRMHKQLRLELLGRGLLKPPRKWRG